MITLSIVEQHFLKKQIIETLLIQEFNKLAPDYSDANALQKFGPPFANYNPLFPPENPSETLAISRQFQKDYDQEFPLLRWFFIQFLSSFPFVERQDESFWIQDIQCAFVLWRQLGISNSNDRQTTSKRDLLLYKTIRSALFYYNSLLRVPGEDAYFEHTDNDYKKVSKYHFKDKTEAYSKSINGIILNVCGVTRVTQEHGWSIWHSAATTSHYDFIISVKREDDSQYYIKRRYKEFVALQKALSKKYLASELPHLPSKIKLNSSVPGQDDETSRLPREKLRISLRFYLQALITDKKLLKSNQLVSFLTENSFTELTHQEMVDVGNRDHIDRAIAQQEMEFQMETVHSIERLSQSVEKFKSDLLGGGDNNGLFVILKELSTKESISSLSLPLRSFIELIKLSIASTLYSMFIANDDNYELFKTLKQLHFLVPYKVMTQILRFTNPLSVINRMINLFLYAPFGGKSLMSLLTSYVLNDDMKSIEKELAGLVDLEFSSIESKIDSYIESDDRVVAEVKKNSIKYQIPVCLAVVLNNNELPHLDEDCVSRVFQSYHYSLELKEYESFIEKQPVSLSAESKPDEKYTLLLEKSLLYNKLVKVLQLKLRMKDKQSLLELWNSPKITAILRKVIVVFFTPLVKLFTKAQVYRYVPVLQSFMNELIDLIETREGLILKGENMVGKFMDLLANYQEHLFQFIHSIYLHDMETEGVFANLIGWFNKFIVLLQQPRDEIDLVKILSETTFDQDELKREIGVIVDEVEKKRKAFNVLKSEQKSTNWDQINSDLGDIFSGGGKNGLLGLSSNDIDEFNLESGAKEKESVCPKASVEKRLEEIYADYAENGVSDLDLFLKAEFRGLDIRRWSQMHETKGEIWKIASSFKNPIYLALQSIEPY